MSSHVAKPPPACPQCGERVYPTHTDDYCCLTCGVVVRTGHNGLLTRLRQRCLRLTAGGRGPAANDRSPASATPAPHWFGRALLSGYVASVFMLLGFVLSYGVATLLASAGPPSAAGAHPLLSWLHGLTHNGVIDWAFSSLYLAVAGYFAGGLLWALLYARFAEPRLRGPTWWRGVQFALLPLLVSVLAVLPLLGAGPLGLALQAGPLPLSGNLILHIVYGLTLGLVYGPLGSLSADTLGPDTAENARAMNIAELAAARGLLAGLGGGAVVGLGAVGMLGLSPPGLGAGPEAAMLVLILVVGGATLGMFLGSLAGLAPSSRPG